MIYVFIFHILHDITLAFRTSPTRHVARSGAGRWSHALVGAGAGCLCCLLGAQGAWEGGLIYYTMICLFTLYTCMCVYIYLFFMTIYIYIYIHTCGVGQNQVGTIVSGIEHNKQVHNHQQF